MGTAYAYAQHGTEEKADAQKGTEEKVSGSASANRYHLFTVCMRTIQLGRGQGAFLPGAGPRV